MKNTVIWGICEEVYHLAVDQYFSKCGTWTRSITQQEIT